MLESVIPLVCLITVPPTPSPQVMLQVNKNSMVLSFLLLEVVFQDVLVSAVDKQFVATPAFLLFFGTWSVKSVPLDQ